MGEASPGGHPRAAAYTQGIAIESDAVYAVLVVGGGTLANLLIGAMFATRVLSPSWASALGFTGTAMAIPLALGSAWAFHEREGAWKIALPLVFVAYAVVEVVLDGILHLPFRSTLWLAPYLILYYAGQWAVIGAAFIASRQGGFVVLVSYFVCLAATLFSLVRVGHGQP